MSWTLQRDASFSTPQKLGDMFSVAKDGKSAMCELWTHALGWELRLDAAGEMLQTRVCRKHVEVLEVFEQWRAAMVEKGWR